MRPTFWWVARVQHEYGHNWINQIQKFYKHKDYDRWLLFVIVNSTYLRLWVITHKWFWSMQIEYTEVQAMAAMMYLMIIIINLSRFKHLRWLSFAMYTSYLSMQSNNIFSLLLHSIPTEPCNGVRQWILSIKCKFRNYIYVFTIYKTSHISYIMFVIMYLYQLDA